MDGDAEEKICVCCKCTDQVTCLDEHLPFNKLLPEWFGTGTCYEQQDDTQYYCTGGDGIQACGYLVYIVEDKRTERRGVMTPMSDSFEGRFAARIIAVDLLRGQEVELKLCPSIDQFDNLSREELCSFWPKQLIPINQEFAMLLLHKDEYNNNSYYVVWLVELHTADGYFKPIYSLTLWDQPGREVFCFGYRNLIDEAGMPVCAFIVNNTSHGDERVTHVTLFVVLNKQKLEILKQVSGQDADWTSCILFACLNGRTLNAFHCESIEDLPRSWRLNLSQLRVYSLDMEAFQMKDLNLPLGYEYEIGQRRPTSREICRFGWFPNKCTVCLKCPPPYYNKFNLFVLDLITFEWQHLDINAALSLSKFHLVNQEEIYVDGGNTLVVHSKHRIIKESGFREVRRFHRIHLGRPATLLELTYRCVAKMEGQKLKWVDNIVAL